MYVVVITFAIADVAVAANLIAGELTAMSSEVAEEFELSDDAVF